MQPIRSAKTIHAGPISAALLASVALLAGCAGGGAPAGVPVADPQATADALIRETTPESPRRALFAWSLDEAGSRFGGSGVVRYEAPERIRLDLFGPRGETYLAAALVGDETRVPPAVASRFALPSPALLWGALGVLRPPAGATLDDVRETEDGELRLRYRTADGETLEFRARDGRLTGVRRIAGGGTAESIDLRRDDAGALRRADYRDWAAYRTLTLELEQQTDESPFDDEIWRPAGS